MNTCVSTNQSPSIIRDCRLVKSPEGVRVESEMLLNFAQGAMKIGSTASLSKVFGDKTTEAEIKVFL